MAEPDSLAMLAGVIDNVRTNTADAMALAGHASTAVEPTLAHLFAQFDEMRTTLGNVAGKAGIALTDPAFVPAQRSQNARAIVAEARAVVASNLTAMKADAATVVSVLTPMALPSRPPVDAMQIAELARREAQLRMVLDAQPVEDITDRLERLLLDAIATGDELGVWHLSASGWAGAYLEGRRAPGSMLMAWNVRASEIAAGAAGDDARLARYLLETVTDSRYNLAGAIQSAEMYIRTALDRVAVVAR